VQTSLVTYLTGSHLKKTMVIKDIVCTFASSNNLRNNMTIAKVLGVDKQNIMEGVETHVLLNIMNETF
jgi:hypothetical protein